MDDHDEQQWQEIPPGDYLCERQSDEGTSLCEASAVWMAKFRKGNWGRFLCETHYLEMRGYVQCDTGYVCEHKVSEGHICGEPAVYQAREDVPMTVAAFVCRQHFQTGEDEGMKTWTPYKSSWGAYCEHKECNKPTERNAKWVATGSNRGPRFLCDKHYAAKGKKKKQESELPEEWEKDSPLGTHYCEHGRVGKGTDNLSSWCGRSSGTVVFNAVYSHKRAVGSSLEGPRYLCEKHMREKMGVVVITNGGTTMLAKDLRVDDSAIVREAIAFAEEHGLMGIARRIAVEAELYAGDKAKLAEVFALCKHIKRGTKREKAT